MRTLKVTVKSSVGLHARPASQLVGVCNQFKSNVNAEKAGTIVNAKSIIALLKLGALKDDCITFEVEGEDEDKATEAIEALFNEGI